MALRLEFMIKIIYNNYVVIYGKEFIGTFPLWYFELQYSRLSL